MTEQLITPPDVPVAEAEYRRLLGYPPRHTPGERAQELARAARDWYATHGRPWTYQRVLELSVGDRTVSFEGIPFPSPALAEHLHRHGAQRAIVFAVSAGAGCEEEAARRWQQARPDEYFFLETFGSAVVEQLVAATNARVCAAAEAEGLSAVPHYSPGYEGWDVAGQNALFELLGRGAKQAFPEPLEVLASGMLRPKKSLLGLIGLAPASATARSATAGSPCRRCSFAPCRYRRAEYRHAAGRGPDLSPATSGAANDAVAPVLPALTPNAAYSVNPRALQKWARERVQLTEAGDATLTARFRFDGTTCSNMGRPLAFEYHVVLGPPDTGYRILRAECGPCADDEGHRFMCEYLRDPDELMAAIRTPPPVVGRPLDDVLHWERLAAPTGCYCDADSRAHKWGLALEVIHFALATRATDPAPAAAATRSL